MKPTPFEYHSPSSIDEVTTLLSELSGAELMAGNQSLGIVMANRLATPDHLIDLNGVDELAGIEVGDDAVEIGALTRHRDIERSADLKEALPVLPESAKQIAGPAVRNRGTLGGSLGEADPAGNYPCVLVGLDAEFRLRSSDGARTVPADEYFIAYMFTDLAEDELLTRVSIPRGPFPPSRTGMAFLASKRASQTFPTVSVAASLRVEADAENPAIEEARISLANVADVPLRAEAAEAELEGGPLDDDAVAAAVEAVREAADPESEMHASAEHKEALAGEYTRRALELAYERATE